MDTTASDTKDNKTNEKQIKILEINRDSSLSKDEKIKKIREIMEAGIEKHLTTEKEKCCHYKKTCSNFHFACCNKFYDCKRCHNEKDECKEKPIVDTIQCDACGETQCPNDICVKCSAKFSRSYCNICNIWSEKNIFHCEECGICRVGNRSQFFHCVVCNLCFKVETKKDHRCIQKVEQDSKCGYCLSNTFDSQNHTVPLKCGHVAHRVCLQKANDYRCPLCRKSLYDMTQAWALTSAHIAQYPIPEELNKKIDVICYDCEKTSNVEWHFMGLKCGECGGYNTSTVA